MQQPLEERPVFGLVNRLRRSADDRHAGLLQRAREFQRRLTAVLHDHAVWFFDTRDFEHILERQRLEVQAVGGVVIGRYRFRVAIHHDGLEAVRPQGHRGVYAAVVKLDSLADAVRPAAEDDDLFPRGRRRLALLVVAGIKIGGRGVKFRRTGIDPLEDRVNSVAVSALAHRLLFGLQQQRDAPVGKPLLFPCAQGLRVEGCHAVRADFGLGFHQIRHFRQEPPIDFANGVDLFDAHAVTKRLGKVPRTFHPGNAQPGGHGVGNLVGNFVGNLVVRGGLADGLADGLVRSRQRLVVQPVRADLQAAQRLLKRLLKGAADGHHFTHRFHLGGQGRVRLRKFLEIESWDLGDHVIDGRLERRRRGAAGDVVTELVQGKTDRQLGRHLGDREAGRLGGQRGRARHPRIHLDDDHPAIVRVDGKLHIRAAGIDADFAQHRDAGVAHNLVFLVGQGLCWRHGDRVTGVHAHRVEVFDGADDDAVVLLIADNLHLDILSSRSG